MLREADWAKTAIKTICVAARQRPAIQQGGCCTAFIRTKLICVNS
ncbi:hypothetical protein P4193_19895 [Pseudomonas aeruginosa]|nr:hypothetical protein [Pseudomonas aeruginosa]